MKFERDYDVVRYTLRKEFDGLLSQSRSSDKQAQENLSWLLYRCHGDVKLPWEKLCDEKWIAELAGECFYPALYVYLRANIYTVKAWSEDFIDENTGKVVSVERDEIESLKPLFVVPQDIQEAMVQKYFDYVYANREHLYLAEEINRIKDEVELCGIYVDRLPQYIEMLEKLAASDSPLKWNEELAALYHEGRPVMGVLRNNAKSLAYYNRAAGSAECSPRWKEENKYLCRPYEHDDMDINNSKLYIQGTKEQLTRIQELIASVCQKHGTPDSEFGLNVPLDVLIYELAGCDEYRGNVQSVTIENEVLTLDVEHENDADEALKYALAKSFDSLSIKIVKS